MPAHSSALHILLYIRIQVCGSSCEMDMCLPAKGYLGVTDSPRGVKSKCARPLQILSSRKATEGAGPGHIWDHCPQGELGCLDGDSWGRMYCLGEDPLGGFSPPGRTHSLSSKRQKCEPCRGRNTGWVGLLGGSRGSRQRRGPRRASL